MTSLGLVHAFTGFRRLGGVESILHKHWREDAQFGLESRFWSLFETTPTDDPRVWGMALDWRSTVRLARSRLRARDDSRGRVIVYHNCWGLPFLADLDGSRRRLGMLHSDWPGLADCLRSFPGMVDGMIVVSEPLRALVHEVWPTLPADRVTLAPSPIDPETGHDGRAPRRTQPLVLGYCGRLVNAQKRVDRFPELAALLDASGLDYRLEFLGDGPDGPRLRAALGQHPRTKFHGRLSGSAYWRVLSAWDAVVFLSEYEGLPLALLEALAAGVVPVFPKIQSGGDAYTLGVDPSLLYPAGDLTSIIPVLRQLSRQTGQEWAALRARATASVAKHTGSHYLNAFASFVRDISNAPPLVPSPLGPRPFRWLDCCPFALLRRLHPLGFWQPGDRPG